jgi:hypothetical protein
VVSLSPAQDGARFREPFTGRISFTPPAIAASGLPDSPSTVLPAGRPINATITVTNSGNSTKDFFADARLDHRTVLSLLGADVNVVSLPLSLTVQPNFFVPPGTDRLLVAAQGTVPIVMDIAAQFGSPDLVGTSLPGNFAVAQATARELAPTAWFALPEARGPFPPGGVTGATVNLAALAATNAFDPAVSASSGDAWLALSVDPNAPYSPLTLAPRQSGTITLTITPNAPKGTVIRGFVAVDTLNLASFSGDELLVIPYTYRVG